MVALSFFTAFCVEEPVLGLPKVLIINGLFPGFHNTFFVKVVIGSCTVRELDGLLAGLHLTCCVEGIFFGVNGEDLQVLFSVVRSTVLEVETEIFTVFADIFHAFNGTPAGSTFSVFIIVFIAGDRWKGYRVIFLICGSCLGSSCSFCRVFCLSIVGCSSVLSGYRKLVPASLHFSFLKGIVGTVDLFVDLIFDPASVGVKIIPGIQIFRIICFFF